MSEENIPKATNEFDSYWKNSARPLDDLEWCRATRNWRRSCGRRPMEDSSTAVEGELEDVTTCCICVETYINPMILPCLHTFCLTCLRGIGHHSGKIPGDSMPCSVCRQEFTIPVDGFAGLQKNFFMVRLIEITAAQQRASSARENCEMHKREKLCLYCSDCSDALCLVCVRECHQNHRLTDLSSAADVLHSQLHSSVKTAKQCMHDALKRVERLREKKSAVFKQIEPFKAEVNQVTCDLKALIDQHADALLQNYESLKTEQLEDIEIERKELDKHLDCLKNFETRCAELASNDQHESVFCKMANELKKQIGDLKWRNKSIVERQLCSFEINFMETDLTEFEIGKTKNFIGVVKAKLDYIGKPELVTTFEVNNTAVNEYDRITGMAVSYNDVFVTYEENPVVSIYDVHTHKCKMQMTLKGFVREVDLKDCVIVAGSYYIVNRITEEILRIDENRDFMAWSTETHLSRLSVSAESTIIAACFGTGSIREYSLQGTMIQEIDLNASIGCLQHAIKLGNGHFVVSYSSYMDYDGGGVCLVNDVGGITKSFVDRSCFRGEIYLAVDEDGNILVLDADDSRLLLFSCELEFKRELLTVVDGLRKPVAMHLDEKIGRLYIADDNWGKSRVLVFNVK